MKQVVLFDAPENIDQKVVFLARVSSENQDNPKYEGLMNYLIREGHWSPLDMVNLTFEINTEKDVGIQLLRHQTLKPQEWSQRYADCSKRWRRCPKYSGTFTFPLHTLRFA